MWCTPREWGPEASKNATDFGWFGSETSKNSTPAGFKPTRLVWYGTMSRSPSSSRLFDRMSPCGRSVWRMTEGLRGSVTSTAVKFLGADSWPSHRMRRPSRASWIAMPSPTLPKPPRSLWLRSRIFFIAPFCAMAVLPLSIRERRKPMVRQRRAMRSCIAARSPLMSAS